jgi:hypothetical protein
MGTRYSGSAVSTTSGRTKGRALQVAMSGCATRPSGRPALPQPRYFARVVATLWASLRYSTAAIRSRASATPLKEQSDPWLGEVLSFVACESQVDVAGDYRFDPTASKVAARTRLLLLARCG